MNTRLCILWLAAGFWLAAGPAQAGFDGAVSSPAFDPGIYKDGAVSQSRRTFGNWLLLCADVAALHRRFCNIGAEARDANTGEGVSFLVSTTEAGRPAALITMPLHVSLRQGVEVMPLAGQPRKPRKLAVLTCTASGCTSVMPLEPADLTALNKRGRLTLRLHLRANGARPERALDVVFDGTGFAEALQESQTAQHQ